MSRFIYLLNFAGHGWGVGGVEGKERWKGRSLHRGMEYRRGRSLFYSEEEEDGGKVWWGSGRDVLGDEMWLWGELC